MSYIYHAMGWILNALYQLLGYIGLGNYAYAILLFTILVNVVFLPLTIRQQKATAKQTALRPKLEALKAKCGDDQRRYQTEMQALYQKEKVSMMGGCWTLLIRLPFLWGVWQAIRSPLSYIWNISAEAIKSASEALQKLPEFANNKVITELDVLHNAAKLGDAAGEIGKIDTSPFRFLGMDLTQTPKFDLNFAKAELIWIIPLLAFATAMLSSVISMRMQKKTNPQAGQMGMMLLFMPLISLWIAFTVPGAVGFYWACSNLVNMVIQIFVNHFYGPYITIARDEAKTVARRKAKENELRASESA